MVTDFFIVALISAALGFGGIAGAATGIAKILFFFRNFVCYLNAYASTTG
jgi:uncharacterized membrane protein YtjA (UPF0391 family)